MCNRNLIFPAGDINNETLTVEENEEGGDGEERKKKAGKIMGGTYENVAYVEVHASPSFVKSLPKYSGE